MPASKDTRIREYQEQARDLLDQTGALKADIDIDTLSAKLVRLYSLAGWAKEVQRVIEHAQKHDQDFFLKWVKYHHDLNLVKYEALEGQTHAP